MILPDQCYTRSEKTIASPATIVRLQHHMDHRLDLWCHPLQHVCSPFEVEGEGEGELIANVVVEIGGGGGGGGVQVMVQIVTADCIHLSRFCLLRYPLILTPHPICIYPPTLTHHLPYPHTLTHHLPYPRHTYTSVPYSVSLEPPSIAVDITLSSHPLSSHTLPPMDDTILDLLPELGPLPARRPRTRRVHRLLHPSVPSAPSAPSAISAPSTPSQTPHDPIVQQAVYFRRRPKRNIKTPSCGTH